MEEPNDDLEAPDKAMRRPSPTLVAGISSAEVFCFGRRSPSRSSGCKGVLPRIKLTAVLLEQGVHYLNIRRGGH